jgi:hypothetical protein
MSVFKPFLAQDIIVTPFPVNKNFTFTGEGELTSSDVGIDRLIGKNLTGSFNPNVDPTTGQFYTGSYQRLVYNSIKELYYTNFLSSSKGDEAPLYIVDNGVEIQANNQQPRYENYLQSTLVPKRYFPTESNSQIGVISIPSTLFGEQIKPKSFTINSPDGSLLDDGEGNIYLDSSSPYVLSGYIDDNYFLTLAQNKIGNIIYPHGIIILTNLDISGSSLMNFITSSNVTMSFSSTYNIYETQYKCTIRESEFNFSLNPSLLSGSTNEVIYSFATGSTFSPYITTVGLYNDNQELLAVAKLSQPLPSSYTTDMNILVNLDR